MQERNALPAPPPELELPEVILDPLPVTAESLEVLERRKQEIIREWEQLDGKIDRIQRFMNESTCGAIDDSQEVEFYDGTLGVTIEFVRRHSPAVGQLQWLDNLSARFSGPGGDPGNVAGIRWCSGALISADLFLSAAHCFDQRGNGWIRPSRQGVTISPHEIAQLMQVNFNYQLNSDTRTLRQEDSYPVAELVEFQNGNLDYAIVRLGRNAAGDLPGTRYGFLKIARQDVSPVMAGVEGPMLCVIQHPNGQPKKIEAGPLLAISGPQISYDTLDTQGGSSGSPVLPGETGEIIGVHTNGGCGQFSGSNKGVAIGAILAVSPVLRSLI